MVELVFLFCFFFCHTAGSGATGDVAQRYPVQERCLPQPGGPHLSRAAAEPGTGPAVSKEGTEGDLPLAQC